MSKDRKPTVSELKAEETTRAAKTIVDAETKVRDAKTAKLKAARLKRDSEVEKPPTRPGRKK